MKRRKKICSLIMILLLSLAFICGGFFGVGFFNVYADRDPAYELLLQQLGFPESYYETLTALHKEHPEWAFLPFQTGLSWEEAVDGECGYRLNLTPNTAGYPTSFHETAKIGENLTFDFDLNSFVIQSAPNWVQASREAIAYYMDPRNFMNSEEIFQFEYLASNPMIQTIEGVERIFAGSFMSKAYVVKPTYFVSGGFVTGIDPETKTKDFLKLLACDATDTIRIWNADHTEKTEDAFIGTGDLITVSEGELLWGADELPEDYVEPSYATYTCIVYGDLDGDGKKTQRDYLYFLRHYYNYSLLQEPYILAMDADFDGKLTERDRLYVLRACYGFSPITQRIVNDLELKPVSEHALYGADGQTYAECVIALSEEFNVSPYMLAVRLRQEQGANGTGALISGKVTGYEGYYNYFNFGASGVTAEEIVQNGLTYAKENGWDSPVKAIRGGAERIVEKYISAGQFTLYLQKFNVIKNGFYALYKHQYMQNLLAARNEAVRTAAAYKELGCLENGYIFYIPVYENMPKDPAPKPVNDGNLNPYLKDLAICGIETLEIPTEPEEDTSEEASASETTPDASREESPATEETGETEETTEPETPTEPEAPTLPALIPEFERSVYRYDVFVEANVFSITLDAQAIANVLPNASSSGRGERMAHVTGAGKKELSYGENVFEIRVTAGNGDRLTYEIHVFRKEPETLPEPATTQVPEED